MVAKKKQKKIKVVEEEEVIIPIKKEPRLLSEGEFEIRDLTWAVGVTCKCGRELDLFQWNIPEELRCKYCGRAYFVKLDVYQDYENERRI